MRHREITKALKVPEDEIREAIGVISRLNPRPGAANFGGDIQPIEPDLTVEKIDGEYVVSLNDGRIPSLRISPYYRKLLPRSAGTGEETRKYITDRLNHARWLIKAIEQRRSTMLKVMDTIVEAQREFLDHGIGRLRPMVLQEVADAIGMHASTVSRVTSGKYAQTPSRAGNTPRRRKASTSSSFSSTTGSEAQGVRILPPGASGRRCIG